MGLGWKWKRKLGLLGLFLLLALCYAQPAFAAKKTVIFMDGEEVYKTFKVKKNVYQSADALPDKSTATFLGWSLTQGKTTDPDMQAEQLIKVDKNLTLYSVYYPLKEEPNLSPSKITAVDTTKYKELIIVGDSRMVRTKVAVGAKVASKKKIIFYAVSGQTLDGFLYGINYTEEALLARVQKKSTAKKPIALVFALGVNDLREDTKEKEVAATYLAYLKKLKSKLKKYNVKLYFLSVCPVSGIATRGRSGSTIRRFNTLMQEGLKGSGYAYLDMYSWMMKNGFSASSIFDGLHYDTKTSKRVLDTLVQMVNGL
ncbi:MAG: hypothetical protein IIZ39_07205 [Blautia sp.]|nr:hypothetical protein [Blautia sp.]